MLKMTQMNIFSLKTTPNSPTSVPNSSYSFPKALTASGPLADINSAAQEKKLPSSVAQNKSFLQANHQESQKSF